MATRKRKISRKARDAALADALQAARLATWILGPMLGAIHDGAWIHAQTLKFRLDQYEDQIEFFLGRIK